jgi:hypothetical protein
MKKELILLSLAFLSATNIFAQRTRMSAKATIKPKVTVLANPESELTRVSDGAKFQTIQRLPKGLRVNVKLTSVANLVVQETAPADMFTFRVYETTLLPQTNDPNSFNFQTCRLNEVFGFQVVGTPRLTTSANGDLVFNFSLTGLREGVSYGVDVFPVNNRVAAAPAYQLNKSGMTSSIYCNSLSAVGGSPIVVQFAPSLPPR